MADDMFLSADRRSLRRGKRRLPRTATCRPCLVWTRERPDEKVRGVVMDVSKAGMRIRTVELIAIETSIVIQMMRDDGFKLPLASPVEGRVIRYESGANGFTDHGILLVREEAPHAESAPVRLIPKPVKRPTSHTRMHTVDFVVGERWKSRSRR